MSAEQANAIILAMFFLAFAVWGLLLNYSDIVVFERIATLERSATESLAPGWKAAWKRAGRLAAWAALMACVYCMWLSIR